MSEERLHKFKHPLMMPREARRTFFQGPLNIYLQHVHDVHYLSMLRQRVYLFHENSDFSHN